MHTGECFVVDSGQPRRKGRKGRKRGREHPEREVEEEGKEGERGEMKIERKVEARADVSLTHRDAASKHQKLRLDFLVLALRK